MKDERYIDHILENFDKENIIKLYQNECSPEEIQKELNMSLVWIKEVINDYNAKREAELSDFSKV